MPLLNSMGIFRAMSILPTGPTPYYFDALDTKAAILSSTPTSAIKLTYVNNKLCQYGYAFADSGGTYINRPYIVNYNSSGTLDSYTLYSDVAYWQVNGVVYDSSGNKHVLFSYNRPTVQRLKFRLIKYDPSGTIIYSKEFNAVSPSGFSDGDGLGLLIDSSDNLICAFNNFGYGASSGVVVFKISAATYTVVWSSQVNNSFQFIEGTNCSIHLDSSSNIILVVNNARTSPSNDLNYCFKFNSSGVLQWTRQIVATRSSGAYPTCSTVIDSSDNIFILMDNKIVKILANGTVSYKHTIGSSTYRYMSLNSLGNLMLASNDSIVAVPKDALSGTTSVASVTYSGGFDFQDILSVGAYTYGLGYLYNTDGYASSALIKLSANGIPPNVGANVNFSQTDDLGTTYTWNQTISISAVSNVAVNDVTMTVNTITGITPTSITLAITDVLVGVTLTAPIVYNTPLR